MTVTSFDPLFKKLHYQFKNVELLTLALTHRSKTDIHNERLEFFGDAIVNMVIAESLYLRFPKATEGALSQWRASLVNREALAELAKTLELSTYILLGQGEKKSGSQIKLSILSGTMEAVIGAMYLDGGLEAVKHSIAQWFQPLLQSLSHVAHHKDPKTLLQEYLQSKRLELPLYTIESVSGAAHNQHFTVSCSIVSLNYKTFGEGSNRRKGEQSAALSMLALLNNR